MHDIKIIANLKEHEQPRIALLENGKLAEIFIEYNFENIKSSRQGDIFKARIDTIIPGISAAFLALSGKNKGNPRNAFLYTPDDKKGRNFKTGQEILVQITKNATKTKAPRVSTRIAVPGRWLVLVPDNQDTGVSKRINDNSERKRLKKIADELKSELQDMGIIIRTAAEGKDEILLRQDLEALLILWNDIAKKAKDTPAPCLLYKDLGALGRVLRDEISGNIDEIIIDDENEFENVKIFLERFYPEKPDINLYSGNTPIFEYFGIESEIDKALAKKVWLRSGAYLVIDQTEALTVIDVNTGKFTNSPDMRHTVLATNIEAAEEIARQIRLRAIGGIVVVDFIDMQFEEDKRELLAKFDGFLCHDRLKARVFSITQLGLVELTRKRERQDLKSVLTRSCPVCGDNGFIERDENIIMRIKRFLRKVINSNNSEAFVIHVSEHIHEHLNQYINAWEKEFDRKIFIVPVKGFENNKFRLDFQADEKRALEHINCAKTLGH